MPIERGRTFGHIRKSKRKHARMMFSSLLLYPDGWCIVRTVPLYAVMTANRKGGRKVNDQEKHVPGSKNQRDEIWRGNTYEGNQNEGMSRRSFGKEGNIESQQNREYVNWSAVRLDLESNRPCQTKKARRRHPGKGKNAEREQI